VCGATVETGLYSLVVNGKAKLRGDDNLFADGREGFAEEFFVGEGAVDLGGVEEVDTQIDGRMEQGDTILFFDGGTVAKAETHAAKTEGGNYETAVAELT